MNFKYFKDELHATCDKAHLSMLLERITNSMEFDWYSLVRMPVSISDQERPTILSNLPRALSKGVAGFGIRESDPIFVASTKTCAGFRWSEVDRIMPLNLAQRAALQRSGEAGVSDAFAVPGHVPGHSSGLVVFATQRPKSLPEAMLPMAQMLGLVALETFRRLTPPADQMITVSLTRRQAECVLLAAQGKTDWEIAKILGVKEHTVSEHLSAARECYGVVRRSQLVAKALFYGLFTLSDIM